MTKRTALAFAFLALLAAPVQANPCTKCFLVAPTYLTVNGDQAPKTEFTTVPAADSAPAQP